MCTKTEHSDNSSTQLDTRYDRPLGQAVNIPLVASTQYIIKYDKVFFMIYIHLAAVYGICLLVTSAKWQTVVFDYCFYIIGGLGITAGAHRLWSHRTYKVKLPLEVFIMILNCSVFQYTILNWVRKHRLHHKCSDTDADPHNARRGFFYSHIGWLLVHKNDIVREREKSIDMSDLANNPVLNFQKKYVVPLIISTAVAIPTLVPMFCWNETLNNAWHLNLLRYVMTLNSTLLVNSAAHLYGSKPYNQNIMPSQNYFVSYMTVGEGFHNYHHAFPCDYRTAELGQIFYYNVTTWFIDLCAWLGWAYDLKTASPNIINKKARATGDGTRFNNIKCR